MCTRLRGLCLETLVLVPMALACLAMLWQQNELRFLHTTIKIDLLLIAADLVTSFPLLCFNAAATRISLISMGMFQYLAPSMTLVIAVMIYNALLGFDRWITFACIWSAIMIFTINAIAGVRPLTNNVV